MTRCGRDGRRRSARRGLGRVRVGAQITGRALRRRPSARAGALSGARGHRHGPRARTKGRAARRDAQWRPLLRRTLVDRRRRHRCERHGRELVLRTLPAVDATGFHLVWPWSVGGAVVGAWQAWAPKAPDAIAASLLVRA